MSQLLFERSIQNLDAYNNDSPRPAFNIVKLNNNLYTNASNNLRTRDDWVNIIPGSAFFQGVDPILGQIIIMVYEDPDSSKISTVLFSSLGEMCYNSLTLDHKSRFFVACQNLRDDLKNSNVRRALAVTLLKTYGSLTDGLKSTITKNSSIKDWDETVAGELASNMELLASQTPSYTGRKLMDFGFLQPHFIESTVLDVIYEDNPDKIETNNELVYLLGEQIDQLFDPLTEYSPEGRITYYESPVVNNNKDDGLTKSICSELLQFQENTTHVLIEFLQEFVIPMRIKALNSDIEGLDITKLNQIFPPTIDEVTRINCILLEALEKAIPFGSFEVIKACGSTIPYFYKAYMRHESAMKSFSHLLKEFCHDYSICLQPQFSERRIESIMNVSLNLTKVKLILERLINIKNWETEDENAQVKAFFQSSVETIDAFARDDLKPYSKRIFTPSGKVLTEICDGVPPLLTYGWLNRKVVSVFDAKNLVTDDEEVIILFNDYVIFAKTVKDEVLQDGSSTIKPHVSDILMNSLMNEKPMKNIPNLKVIAWSSVGNFEIVTYGNNNIKIMLNDTAQDTLVYKVENSTKFVSLLNKSKILNKSTPFHLFKNVEFGFTIYSAAHERKIFSREISTSPIALFLNLDIDIGVLEDYKLFAGLSAKFVDEDLIRVEGLTIDGERSHYTLNSSELSSFISEKLSALELQRHNFGNSEMFKRSLESNTTLLKSIIQQASPGFQVESGPSEKSSSTPISKTSSRKLSAASCNKPLPKIIDTSKPNEYRRLKNSKEIEAKPKKNNLKKRLSQIFSYKKSKSEKAFPLDLTHKQGKEVEVNSKEVPSTFLSRKRTSSSESDTEEVNFMDDCITFESSMTPVFDDNDELTFNFNVKSLIEDPSNENWLLARDSSSKSFGLKVDNVSFPEHQESNHKIESPIHDSPKQTTQCGDESKAPHEVKNPIAEQVSTQLTPRKFSTFNSLDEEFKTPILRVGYDSTEDLNNEEKDDDIFYTPKSFGDQFPEFGSMESLVSKRFDELSKMQNIGASDSNSILNVERNMREIKPTTELVQTPNLLHSSSSLGSHHESMDNFDINSLDWRSPSELNFSRLCEDNIANDESFGYLAGVLDNSCIITEGVKSSETYKTLPRSYSSIKYLGAYIDNATPISQDLLDFLHE